MVEKENDIAPAAAAVKKSENNNAAIESATKASANGTSGNKQEDLKTVAFHFLTAYYTKLSDHPNEIGIFYGEDSTFVIGSLEETGRENIQRAIAGMNFGDCKSRFFSIQAATSMADSKVFQVCGELTLKGQPAPRRFCQTIVLALAPPNVLYVKSNIFQWMDIGFPGNESDKVQFYSPPPPATILPPPQGQPMENGMPPNNMAEPMLNGGSVPHIHNNNNVQQPVAVNAVLPSPQPVSPEPTIMAPPPGMGPNPSQQQQQVSKSPEKQPVLNGFTAGEKAAEVEADEKNIKTTPEEVVTVTDAVKSEQAMPPSKPKPTEPKSWNKVVSSGNQGQPTANNNRPHPPPLNNVNVAAPMKPIPHQQHHKKNTQHTGIPKTNSFPAVEQHNQQKPKVKENSAPNDSPPPNAVPAAKKRSASNDDGSAPFIAPRKDWPHRIYFNNLNKPGRFVDFKVGQQQFMKQLKEITQGVEFVAIKPLSLRKEYKHAFGFVDFTSAEDMQAVYDAAKKDDEKGSTNKQLKVSIPEFEFDGFITLTDDKTTNLPPVGPGFYGGGGRPHPHNNQPQQNFHHRGGEQRKMAQPTKG